MKIDPLTGLQALEKQEGEAKTFTWDFTADLQGATISSITSTAQTNLGRVTSSVPVALGTASFNTNQVQARIGSGTHGEDYKMTALVLDSNGNTLELDGLLQVRNS